MKLICAFSKSNWPLSCSDGWQTSQQHFIKIKSIRGKLFRRGIRMLTETERWQFSSVPMPQFGLFINCFMLLRKKTHHVLTTSLLNFAVDYDQLGRIFVLIDFRKNAHANQFMLSLFSDTLSCNSNFLGLLDVFRSTKSVFSNYFTIFWIVD